MRWMWIDAITQYEPDKRLVAVKNVSLSEEHIHDHFAATDDLPAQPMMPNSLIVEGMAQTAGILVGSVNSFREKVVLAKIVRASIERDVLPGQSIRYDATIERMAKSKSMSMSGSRSCNVSGTFCTAVAASSGRPPPLPLHALASREDGGSFPSRTAGGIHLLPAVSTVPNRCCRSASSVSFACGALPNGRMRCARVKGPCTSAAGLAVGPCISTCDD